MKQPLTEPLPCHALCRHRLGKINSAFTKDLAKTQRKCISTEAITKSSGFAGKGERLVSAKAHRQVPVMTKDKDKVRGC